MQAEETDVTTKNELVVKGIGALTDATDELAELDDSNGVDPEEVGSWITILGRALLAIIKP